MDNPGITEIYARLVLSKLMHLDSHEGVIAILIIIPSLRFFCNYCQDEIFGLRVSSHLFLGLSAFIND